MYQDVSNWTEQLIEGGTGLEIPVYGAPLHAFEARRISWQHGQALITGLETDQDRVLPLIRFGFLRLAEVSLIEYSQNWRSVDPANAAWGNLSSRGKFLALQGWHEASAPQPAQNRPSRSDVWRILTALRYELYREAVPPREQKLVELTDQVYPPLFLLDGQSGRGRHVMLSEALSKYLDPLEPDLRRAERKNRRRNAEAAHYAWALSEMSKTSPP